MTSELKTCSQCGKRKREREAASLTQWLFERDYCSCDKIVHDGTVPSNTQFCRACERPVQSGRAGSMTQWIFRGLTCKCEQPLLEPSLARSTSSGTSLEGGEGDARIGDGYGRSDGSRERDSRLEQGDLHIVPEGEVELVLDPERFPVERYKPLQELGRGASGAVFLCRDRILGEKVAVKTLRQLNAEQLMAFQSEARASSKLNHPAIITLLDFGPTPAGAPYMVLAYFRGATLEEFLRKNGQVPLPMFKQIFESITSALAHAHSKGIFHRDLKPSNILIDTSQWQVTSQLQVKLIDFGVARIKEDTQAIEFIDERNVSPRSKTEPSQETESLPGAVPAQAKAVSAKADAVSAQARTIAGTPAYMPPDAVLGKTYDARSEVYALGCVLFECLTGKPPFSGETALETMNLHATAVPSTLREAAKQAYPEEVEALIGRCLSKEPNERFASMEELNDAIRVIEISSDTAPNMVSESNVNDALNVVGASSVRHAPNVVGASARRTIVLFVTSGVLLLLVTAFFVVRGFDSERGAQQLPKEAMKKHSSEIRDLKKLGLSVTQQLPVKTSANKLDEVVAEANAYFHGRGVPRDYYRAAALYLKAAKQGNPDAQESIGFMLEQGLGVVKNDQKAFGWYQKSALQNNAAAQLNLGTMYLEGRGTSLDYAESMHWFEKAAAAGNARAQNNLGYQFQHGLGVDVDYDKAVTFYLAAAKDGREPMANVNLGDVYREGVGVERDDKKALAFYRLAAEQEIAAGQRCYAFMFANGIGTKKNYSQALMWYRKAATRGDVIACQWLGVMALNGMGMKRNPSEACGWYLKAAERGDIKSQCALGRMYEKGIGVEKDVKESIRWYRTASEAGSLEAQKALRELD